MSLKKYSYIGTVEGGKLKLTEPVRRMMEADIATLDGKRVEVEIRRLSNRRSLPQNAYYHGVIVRMLRDRLQELGHNVTSEDTHHYLKDKFNGKDIINPDTAEVVGKIGGSTADMSKVDMMGYIAAIQQWAAEVLELYIPDPETQLKLDWA